MSTALVCNFVAPRPILLRRLNERLIKRPFAALAANGIIHRVHYTITEAVKKAGQVESRCCKDENFLLKFVYVLNLQLKEEKAMSKKMQSNILLLITAFIWGSAFVAQKSGMDYIEPFTFNGIRTLIGGLVLIPVVFIMNKGKSKELEAEQQALTDEEKAKKKRDLIIGGICCGTALFIASSFQQFGVSYTTAGKAGFITTLYVVIVPILSILLRKRVRPIMWLCVVLGAIGLYLLCMTDKSFSLAFGDMLVLICAVFFAVHIMTVDYFTTKADGVQLSCIQFLAAGVEGLVCMLIFENPDINAILNCWMPLLYAGVLSCGVGYTFQVIAQKHAEPTVASLIMSLESAFAVVCGALLLHESMTPRELSGCVIIFAAVIISQIPERKKKEGIQ